MKKRIIHEAGMKGVLVLLGISGLVHAGDLTVPRGVELSAAKDEGRQAIEELVGRFVEEGWGDDLKRFALLPPPKDLDEGYFTLQFQNAFARIGRDKDYELYTRDDARVAALLEEIRWGQDYGDVMDPATIQKFGRIQGVEGLIVCRVDLEGAIPSGAAVRVNLAPYEVETGRQLGGGEVSRELPVLGWLGEFQWLLIIGVGVIAAALGIKFYCAMVTWLRDRLNPRGSQG